MQHQKKRWIWNELERWYLNAATLRTEITMAFGPFFVGELPPFTFNIKDKVTGAAVDLSGMTAKCMMKKKGAAANREPTAAGEDAVVADAANGIITYTPSTAFAVADKGHWSLQVQLLPGAGGARKTAKQRFNIEDGFVPVA